MSGSENEPVVPLPEQAAEQMHEATERLRDQGWMVAPLTSSMLPTQQTEADVDS